MESRDWIASQKLLSNMTPELAVQVFRHALIEVFWLALPVLAIGFVVGIVISLVQVLTSIQDTSFSAVPKLLAFLFGLLLLLPWMTTNLIAYTTLLLGDFSKYAH
jgi:flagellar biosynthesis protein FliQ